MEVKFEEENIKIIEDYNDEDYINNEIEKLNNKPNTERILTSGTLKSKYNFKEFKEMLYKSFAPQKEVLQLISKPIFSYTFLQRTDRPLNFIFTGPPGTGKTYLATKIVEKLNKTISNGKFESQIINCSELQNEVGINRILGTTKGYVGYGTELDFFEKLSKSKYQIIVFDEIEKAHNKILLTLLNLLNEGRMKSLDEKYYVSMDPSDPDLINYINSKDKTGIYIEKLIIIFTSNIVRSSEELYTFLEENNFFGKKVNDDIIDFLKKVFLDYNNYISNKDDIDINDYYEIVEDILVKKMKVLLIPEFVDRINKILLFKKVDTNSVKVILKEKIKTILNKYDIDLETKEIVKEKVLKKFDYKNINSIRDLDKKITQYIDNLLLDIL